MGVWIGLMVARVGSKGRAFVYAAVDLRVPYKEENFQTS